MKNSRWVRAGLGFAVGLCLCYTLSSPVLADVVGYPGGRLVLADEPGSTSEYVEFYRGGERLPVDQIIWTEGGIHGKAIQLDGQSEYLLVNYSQLQMPTLTLAAWVKWQGSPSKTESGMFGQRLFTMYRDEENFLTVSLRMRQENAGEQGGRPYAIDGLYMEYRRGGENGVQLVAANPVFDGENYAIPLQEWHHFAMTMNGQNLRLYVDGILWFEKELLLGVADMQATALLFGNGIWGEPTLYAQIDDVALFNTALSSSDIGLLADGASLRLDSPTTGSAAYLPTAPAIRVTETTATATAATPSPWQKYTVLVGGLPIWTWGFLGVLLLLFVLSTIAVNVRVTRQETRTTEEQAGDKGESASPESPHTDYPEKRHQQGGDDNEQS